MTGLVVSHQRGWKSPFFVPSGRNPAISTPRWGTNTWFPADGGEINGANDFEKCLITDEIGGSYIMTKAKKKKYDTGVYPLPSGNWATDSR